MSKRWERQSAAPGVLADRAYGITFDWGNTVPSDGTKGYAPGAFFIQTDGTAGTQWYVNEGTFASADFNAALPPFGSLAGVTATAAELNTMAGILATTAELNRIADVSTRIVNQTTASLSVTEAAHDGKVIVLDRAAGIAVTLPTASAGLWFRFIVKTTFTGAASIKSATGADIMIGHATMGNDSNNSTVDFQATAANTFDTIDLFGTANSTGGIEGQEIEIIGLAANLWWVRIEGDAAGTEATPFQDTVA